jgi:hypothetical protein
MRALYGRFQRFAKRQVEAHRAGADARGLPDAGSVAWAIVGLGTVANIGRELGLLSARARREVVGEVGRTLLGRR